MDDFETAADIDSQLVPPVRAPLCVGLSGGVDSTVLLHALARSDERRADGLQAVHVHHGLHVDADLWAEKCIAFCDSLEIPLVITKVMVDRHGEEGLEAAARNARYHAFEEVLPKGGTLVTAHHRDDQAETFLLRALRGSGPDGLAAMRPWRTFSTGTHWRPLLQTSRDQLLAYAHQHRLSWVEDPGNQDVRHSRNFLRQRILPLLRERWPQAEAALARSATLNADALELLDPEDAIALAASRTLDPHTLSTSALMRFPAGRRARVLRRWVESLRLPPLPGEGVAHIESDLLTARRDARARFVWKSNIIERWRDLLHAQALVVPFTDQWNVQWNGSDVLPLPGGRTLQLVGLNALPSPVTLSARRGGERILLPGRTQSHSLKNVLQELGVPPWEREVLPLVYAANGELLAIGDLAYSAGFDSFLRQHGARLHWHA